MILLFFEIGAGEIFIVVIAIFFLFGPDKLPEISKKIRKVYNEYRNTTEKIKNEINNEVDSLKNTFDDDNDYKAG